MRYVLVAVHLPATLLESPDRKAGIGFDRADYEDQVGGSPEGGMNDE